MEAQCDEYSSTSFVDVRGPSLSLFSISAYESNKENSINIVERNAKGKSTKGRFHKLSRVKNATRCAAKKLNRILVKAKTKLIKPACKQVADISIISASTQSTDISTFYEEEEMDEFEDVNLAEFTEFSPRSVIIADDWEYQDVREHRVTDLSWMSFSASSTFDASSSDEKSQSSTQMLNETVSSGNGSLIQQVLAESMADLNKICIQTEETPFKPIKIAKMERKGTPYKMKVPKRLTLYDASEENFQLKLESPDEKETKTEGLDWNENTCFTSNGALKMKMTEDAFGQPELQQTLKSHFILDTTKELLSNQLARKYHQLYQKFISKPRFFLQSLIF